MKLKNITPNMAIHCKNKEEVNFLWQWFCEHGYESEQASDSLSYMLTYFTSCPNACFYIKSSHSWDCGVAANLDHVTEFSSLILPEEELSPEEVIPLLTDICRRYNDKEDCEGCPLNGLERVCNGNECPFTFKDYHEVLKIAAEWKRKAYIHAGDIIKVTDVKGDSEKAIVTYVDGNDINVIFTDGNVMTINLLEEHDLIKKTGQSIDMDWFRRQIQEAIR